MKYNPDFDTSSRYIRFEISSSNVRFSVKGQFTFEFPPPAYAYQMSDGEIADFTEELNQKWRIDFEQEVIKVMKRCKDGNLAQTTKGDK